MDGVQRYIANADDRPADEVERADAALCCISSSTPQCGHSHECNTFTRLILLRVRVLKLYWRLKDMATQSPFINGFQFIEDLLPRRPVVLSKLVCSSILRRLLSITV